MIKIETLLDIINFNDSSEDETNYLLKYIKENNIQEILINRKDLENYSIRGGTLDKDILNKYFYIIFKLIGSKNNGIKHIDVQDIANNVEHDLLDHFHSVLLFNSLLNSEIPHIRISNLNLNFNFDVVTDMGKALTINSFIKALELVNCNLSLCNAYYILKNKYLEELSLYNNKIIIEAEAVNEWVEHFKNNNILMLLILNGNDGISKKLIKRLRMESNLLYINCETTSHYNILKEVIETTIPKVKSKQDIILKDLIFLRKHKNQVIYLLQYEFKYSPQNVDTFINEMEINLADKILLKPYSVFCDLPLEVLANICKNISYEALKNVYLANLRTEDIKRKEKKNDKILEQQEAQTAREKELKEQERKQKELEYCALSPKEKNKIKNYTREKGFLGFFKRIIKAILRFFSNEKKQKTRSTFIEVLDKVENDTVLTEEQKKEIEYGGVLYVNKYIEEEHNKTESNMKKICQRIIQQRKKVNVEIDDIYFNNYRDYITKMKEKPRNYEGLC